MSELWCIAVSAAKLPSDKVIMETNVDKHMICTECDYTCAGKGQMTRHMKTHSKKRPALQFNCDDCGLTFDTGRKLKNHEKKTHQEEDPRFECESCGQKFNTSRTLKNHSAKLVLIAFMTFMTFITFMNFMNFKL